MAKKTVSGVDLGPSPPEARPKKQTEAAEEITKPVGIRLPVELIAELDKIAKAHQVTRTALVRYALSRFLDDLDTGRLELPTRTVTALDI